MRWGSGFPDSARASTRLGCGSWDWSWRRSAEFAARAPVLGREQSLVKLRSCVHLAVVAAVRGLLERMRRCLVTPLAARRRDPSAFAEVTGIVDSRSIGPIRVVHHESPRAPRANWSFCGSSKTNGAVASRCFRQTANASMLYRLVHKSCPLLVYSNEM